MNKKHIHFSHRHSISTYSLGIALVALLPVIIVAILTANEADSIQKKAQEGKLNQAREELESAVSKIVYDMRSTANEMANWDETRAQLINSTYYQYWKNSRVKEISRIQSLLAEVDLFDKEGKALDTSSSFSPVVEKTAINNPLLYRNNAEVFLLYQHPIKIKAIEKDQRDVIGYLGMKIVISKVLSHYHHLSHLDVEGIDWDIAESEFLKPLNAVQSANLSVHRSQSIDAFADLARGTAISFVFYVLLLIGFIAILWTLLISRPLERLAMYIKALYEGKVDKIPDNLQGIARVKELEEVRVAMNDYIDKFLHATNSLVEKNKELTNLTYRDTLTGMFNRRAFEKHLAISIKNARDEGTQHVLCYLDLDQFKIVNDTCGHIAGDALLKQVAFRLQNKVRKADMLARLGGDEFAVILEGCDIEGATKIADSMRSAVEQFRFAWEDRLFEVGVSIGVVPITADSTGGDDLLRAADSACYVAKDLGRNRVHVYQLNDTEVARRMGEMQWVSSINRALDENRFYLYFQPIVPIKNSDRISHFELLLRMQDGSGNMIPPMAFLPAAERYQLMPKIDRWVVAAALKALSSGNLVYDNYQPLVAINLSGQSLGDDDFLNYTKNVIAQENIDPSLLCFEITETAAITNLTAANRFISTLGSVGCHFALDDFGSGLSSFSYLKTLSVNFLKIDGHFIKNMLEDPINRTIVESIHQISSSMGLETVAEYVEDEKVLYELEKIGIDYVQGLAISEPVALPDTEKLAATAL